MDIKAMSTEELKALITDEATDDTIDMVLDELDAREWEDCPQCANKEKK